MSWQKCPVCDGVGTHQPVAGLQAMRCDVCDGRKIINEHGHPPARDRVEQKPTVVPELEGKDIVAPLSVMDEPSDDEILYYSTPYYDVLQAKKDQRTQQLAEEKLTRGND